MGWREDYESSTNHAYIVTVEERLLQFCFFSPRWRVFTTQFEYRKQDIAIINAAYNSVTSSKTMSIPQDMLDQSDRVSRRSKLTDEVIKAKECASEFPVILHNDPDTGPNTPIDQLCCPEVRRQTRPMV